MKTNVCPNYQCAIISTKYTHVVVDNSAILLSDKVTQMRFCLMMMIASLAGFIATRMNYRYYKLIEPIWWITFKGTIEAFSPSPQ